MCGRLACRQRQAVYQEACAYQGHGNYVKPELHELNNCGKCFIPSANLTPSEISPVLVGKKKLNDSEYRQLCPMVWGIIPPWHKGNFKNHGLTTNNCRIESIVTSKLYGPLLKNGDRCIVICDGFYEWQTSNKSKQPYFIYSPQPEKVKIEEVEDWERGKFDSESGWSGPKPLYMAGLYSTWQSEDYGEVYSYTVITKESDSQFSWLHHRVPCILSEELAEIWLSDERMSIDKSISILKEANGPIASHPVSTSVNNAKNKSDSCNKRIKIKNSTITSWLKRSSSSSSDVAEKKFKDETNPEK